MADLLAERAALARMLAELDEPGLAAARLLLAALRSQARLRDLARRGALSSPELMGVAFAELPEDAAMDGGRAFLEADLATIDQMLAEMPANDVLGRMSFEGRRAETQRELDELPRSAAVARRCPTCRDVVLDGRCSCDDEIDAAVAAVRAEDTVAELELVTEPAPIPFALADSARQRRPDLAQLADAVDASNGIPASLRPGDRVEVVVAIGSKTGTRPAIGKWIGTELNARTGDRDQLVEVEGVVRAFAAGAVRRVG